MWKDQQDKMLRSFAKAKLAEKIVFDYAAGYSQPGGSELDDIYVCAHDIYHFKDWIISSKIIPKEDVYEFINKNEAFRICEKICIGTKHLTTEFREGRILIETQLIDPLQTQKGALTKQFIYIVEFNGKKYQLMVLFEELVSAWGKFIAEKAI